jgi:hypothetical protein
MQATPHFEERTRMDTGLTMSLGAASEVTTPPATEITQFEGKQRGNIYYRAEVQLGESYWTSRTFDTFLDAYNWVNDLAERREWQP